MNDLEMIARVESMHSEMKELCLKSGISKSKYKKSLVRIRNLAQSDLEKRCNFFIALNPYWMEYKRIWEQHTELEWKQLRILSGNSLREQKSLKAAKEALRDYWDDNFAKAIA